MSRREEEADHPLDCTEERVERFLEGIQGIIDSNQKALSFLKGAMSESKGKVTVGLEHIIASGNLATYCIPIKPLMEKLTNPLAESGDTMGMPLVAVHPKHHWVESYQSACVQTDESFSEIPALDSLTSLVLGLMNDEEVFMLDSSTTLRNALIGTYGYSLSPISEVLTSYLWNQFGATFDSGKEEIRVPGEPSGFTWHLGYSNPQCLGFSLSLSDESGTMTPILRDTIENNGGGKLNSLDDMIGVLVGCPDLLIDEDHWDPFTADGEFRARVATAWPPLRSHLDRESEESFSGFEGLSSLFG